MSCSLAAPSSSPLSSPLSSPRHQQKPYPLSEYLLRVRSFSGHCDTELPKTKVCRLFEERGSTNKPKLGMRTPRSHRAGDKVSAADAHGSQRPLGPLRAELLAGGEREVGGWRGDVMGESRNDRRRGCDQGLRRQNEPGEVARA